MHLSLIWSASTAKVEIYQARKDGMIHLNRASALAKNKTSETLHFDLKMICHSTLFGAVRSGVKSKI